MNPKISRDARDKIFAEEMKALAKVHEERLAAFATGLGSEIKLACDSGTPLVLVLNELTRITLESLSYIAPKHLTADQWVADMLNRFRPIMKEMVEEHRKTRKAV